MNTSFHKYSYSENANLTVFLNILAFEINLLNKFKLSITPIFLNIKISIKQIAINFGLILSAYNVITGLLLVSLNLHYQNNSTIGLINLVIIIGVITYGIYHFKKSNDGYLKVSEALKAGMGISFVSGLISSLYSMLLVYVIDPDFIEKTLEFQKKIMLDNNKNLTLENANKMVDLQKKLTGPLTTSGFIIIFNLFIGFIVSIIVGLVFNKSSSE